MRILRLVADVYWFFSRWTFRSEPAPQHSGILLAAPHTSNWDFVLMLGVAWRAGFRPKFLGKKELFRGPAGPIMRALGGVAVDRKNPARPSSWSSRPRAPAATCRAGSRASTAWRARRTCP